MSWFLRLFSLVKTRCSILPFPHHFGRKKVDVLAHQIVLDAVTQCDVNFISSLLVFVCKLLLNDENQFLQGVQHIICDAKVMGSNPISSPRFRVPGNPNLLYKVAASSPGAVLARANRERGGSWEGCTGCSAPIPQRHAHHHIRIRRDAWGRGRQSRTLQISMKEGATEGKTLKHTTMKLSSLFTSKISYKEVLKEKWKHTSLNFTKGKRVYILDADTQTRRT